MTRKRKSRSTKPARFALARERAKRLKLRKQAAKREAQRRWRAMQARVADRAFMQVLGYVPAYKRGQSPEERAIKRKLRRSSKLEGCGDAVAKAHASPAKIFKRGKAGVGVKRRGGPTK